MKVAWLQDARAPFFRPGTSLKSTWTRELAILAFPVPSASVRTSSRLTHVGKKPEMSWLGTRAIDSHRQAKYSLLLVNSL